MLLDHGPSVCLSCAPNAAIDQELAIVHIDKVVHNFAARACGRIQQENLLLEALLENVLVQLTEVRPVLFVDLNELLGVVYLLLEQNEVGHLTDEIVADAHLRQFGTLVEFGIVHTERHNLLVVDDSDQLSPRKERLIVLQSKVVPLVSRELLDQEPV